MGAFHHIQRENENNSQTLIQPQLEIGGENDEYEKEANHVADKVMRMTDPSAGKRGMMHTGVPAIQKMSTGTSAGMMAPAKVEQGINSSKGSGQNLQPEIQNEMSSKVGADFSNVNIHTDASAIQMNKDIGAKAFTHGNDIYFNEGQYNPASSDGKHLLAHELTHTVQQGSSIKPKIQKANFKPDQKVATGGGEWTTKEKQYRFRYDYVFGEDQKEGAPQSYTPQGAVIKLTFTPSEEIKGQATQIALVQKVITMDANPEPKNSSIYNEGKVYPDETAKNRSAKSGARIDKPSDEDNPIYTTKSEYGDESAEAERNKTKELKDTEDYDVIEGVPKGKEFFGHQYNSKAGDANAEDAVLVDTPSIPSWVHPAGQTFEVAALVVDGTEAVKGKYLGSVSWGWKSTGKEVTPGETAEGVNIPVTPGKQAELLDLTVVSSDFVSDEFVEVATKWNESKTSDPAIETIDLPTTKK